MMYDDDRSGRKQYECVCDNCGTWSHNAVCARHYSMLPIHIRKMPMGEDKWNKMIDWFIEKGFIRPGEE